MKSIRRIKGSQAVEYVIIGAILLGLSLGAITIFGAQIAKVFEGDSSPVMVSSSSMTTLENESEAESATNQKVRLNIDGNLVTNSLITKSQTDLSIGSAVGQETTGATGGDAIIGGTYDVEDESALYDGDSETTGNALLDSALASKKSAINLMNDALSASSLAKVLEDQANNISTKIAKQEDILTDVQASYDALVDQSNTVQEYIDLLSTLKSTKAKIGTDIATILENTKKVNLDILDQTNDNLLAGASLLELSNEQNDALDAYNDMIDEYEAGKELSCDGDAACEALKTSYEDLQQKYDDGEKIPGCADETCTDNLEAYNDLSDLYDLQQASADWATDCVALSKPCTLVTAADLTTAQTTYEDSLGEVDITADMLSDAKNAFEDSQVEINTSGITKEELEAENAKVEDMMASLKGQTLALEETIEELSDVVNFLNVQADEAEKTAEDLLDKAKDTLKKAFWDDHLFDDCTTVDEFLTKANNTIDDEDYWYDDVQSYHKAKKALELLADASTAYTTAEDLSAKALQGQTNLDQYQDTLEQINEGVVNIELVSSQVEQDKFEEQQDTINEIADKDDQLAQAQSDLTSLVNAIQATADTITTQQVYINNLNDKATEAVTAAQEAQDEADALVADAQAAVDSADELINEIVTYK